MLDAQRWQGQAQFRSRKLQNWYYKDGKLSHDGEGQIGGTWKGVDRLRLYTVDEAGHFSAMNQPEAIGAVVGAWLRNEL